MRTAVTGYEYYYKKLKSKQRKALDSLQYYVEWSGDMFPCKDGKYDIFKGEKIKWCLAERLSKNEPVTLENLKSDFRWCYWARTEYELWENGNQINNLYDIIELQIEDIYKYVQTKVNS
ncbi:MAG: hypothetical protein FWF46_02045 [Oscillospiraceae bacterium]|nr:hypothetical protein [Oscillospiraceae bacterium]